MSVVHNIEKDNKQIAEYIGNRIFQPKPKVRYAEMAPQEAITGAKNEAIAFTNCPNVRVEANLSDEMIFVTNGFSDVCINALPMPSNENAVNMAIYESAKIGIINDTSVIAKLTSTVCFRPMRFINIPVGTENIRNQKNTNEGRMFA
jgi:hypothetical protein